MTGWQALAVFAGGPALIVLLIFLPFYGRRWARRLLRLRDGALQGSGAAPLPRR